VSNGAVVGRSFPLVDGVEKVTGRGVYGVDVRVPGMLFARILRSPWVKEIGKNSLFEIIEITRISTAAGRADSKTVDLALSLNCAKIRQGAQKSPVG